MQELTGAEAGSPLVGAIGASSPTDFDHGGDQSSTPDMMPPLLQSPSSSASYTRTRSRSTTPRDSRQKWRMFAALQRDLAAHAIRVLRLEPHLRWPAPVGRVCP